MTPDPISIAAWLAAVAFLVGLVNGALRLTDRLKEKPIPSETYLTKESWVRDHSHIAERVATAENQIVAIRGEISVLAKTLDETGETRAIRMHDRIDALRVEVKADVRSLHERVNLVLAAVSKIEGRL